MKVICGITMSVDGFVAGLNMTEEKPFGDIEVVNGIEIIHRWMFEEPEKHKEELASLVSTGAFIMGRNMFGPKGAKYDNSWKGWWGEDPPYHAPVFVLTHRKRESFKLEGSNSFSFVTEGIEKALELAKKAAGKKDVAIAGGANVVNQYLAAGLIDELTLHIAPVTLGKGQKLFEGVSKFGMVPVSCRTTKLVTHIKYRKLK